MKAYTVDLSSRWSLFANFIMPSWRVWTFGVGFSAWRGFMSVVLYVGPMNVVMGVSYGG